MWSFKISPNIHRKVIDHDKSFICNALYRFLRWCGCSWLTCWGCVQTWWSWPVKPMHGRQDIGDRLGSPLEALWMVTGSASHLNRMTCNLNTCGIWWVSPRCTMKPIVLLNLLPAWTCTNTSGKEVCQSFLHLHLSFHLVSFSCHDYGTVVQDPLQDFSSKESVFLMHYICAHCSVQGKFLPMLCSMEANVPCMHGILS